MHRIGTVAHCILIRLDPISLDITTQFNPKDNVNFCRITGGQLASAGMNDGHPGPGVIVSLAQNEVSSTTRK